MGANKQAAIRQAADEAAGPPSCVECGGALEPELAHAGICMACVIGDDGAGDEPGPSLTLGQVPGKTREQSLAAHLLRPALQSGVTAWQWHKQGVPGLNVNRVIECVEQATGPGADGLAYCESVLLSQVHALDTVANNLLSRAAAAQHMLQLETYMRLGLKAQAQCRAAAVAYADIKQPRQTAFVKQANIAHGPQQINNGVTDANDEGRTAAGRAGLVDARAPGLAGIVVPGTEALAEACYARDDKQAGQG